MKAFETEVLVVGAGPAGLASAIELGTRGVRVVVVESNARVGSAPRAKTTNVRTRTHLRRWGIADRLAQESPFGIEYPNTMVFVTRLAGYELARFENALNASPERCDLYPEHAQWIPQYKLEQVLLEKVRSLPGVEVRFDTTFLMATQDDDQVTATLESDGERFSAVSRYLIGADGSRSAVRDLIGTEMHGQRGLSYSYNIIFRAPGLAEAHSFGPGAIYWQIGKNGWSAIGPMDAGDLWFFMPGGARRGDKLTDQQAIDLIVERTGIALPYEIISSDAWTANDLLADSYADRRIILAGDACHLHPPFGGYGMNMGVGDGVDLGWKIAATLQGWGGADLVASYETERRPVHRAVIDEAVANHGIALTAVPAEIEEATLEGALARERFGAAIQSSKGREFYTLGTVLGVGYEASPLVAHEAEPPPVHDSQTYVPTARPGYLAPHAWLTDGRSLYDLFGPGFTLMTSVDVDTAETDVASHDAEELGVPFTIVRAEGVRLEQLYGARLALIRPDQHVAWRGSAWDRQALVRAIGRSGE